VLALEQNLEVVGQLKRTVNEVAELLIAELHLLCHVRAILIVYFTLSMTDLGKNAGPLAVVVKEVEVVIGLLFVGILKALF
jgi:hypothetical protein